MPSLLFIIPSLEYNGVAKQMRLLASALPPEDFPCRVCVLGKGGPWAEWLSKAGILVEVLGCASAFDWRPLYRLRQCLQGKATDILHVWRPPPWLTPLLPFAKCRRLVVSAPLPPRGSGRRVGWLDVRLLRLADRVVVPNAAEAGACRRLGVADGRLAEIAPGVETATGPVAPAHSPRLLAAVGPLERHKGYRDAVWALDILRYLYDDLRLLLVGRGADRPALERFAHVAGVSDRVEFAGEVADVPALLGQAALLWAPAHSGAGVNAVLEAMAAGLPVVAARVPGLADVVVEGVTGFLVPPNDKAALARQTHVLLQDAGLRQRLGQAGRRRAAEHFAAADMVARYARLYAGLA